MKRILSGAVISALLIPGLTFAQTTDNTALIQQLYQLLAVLEQEIAQIEATQALTTPTQSTAPQTAQTNPLFGATITAPQSQPQPQIMPADQSAITVEVTNVMADPTHQWATLAWVQAHQPDFPYGYYYLQARVLDKDGNVRGCSETSCDVPISMIVGSSTQDATIDTLRGQNKTDFYHIFTYTPTATGTPVTLTFTSGTLTKQVTITP